ncbi:hypothetical protein [Polymorphospora sp. NPDC050346]|uniref:hypothetical protein n=1 Tax=Polymorphospora sp. NPDC050346 TaxID=3155780 RepID=UPI0033E7202D
MDLQEELPAFLAWIDDQPTRPREAVDVSAYQADEEHAFELVRICAARDWVRSFSSSDGPAARLTATGRALAEQHRRKVKDPARRAKTTRTVLLRWMYQQHVNGVDWPDTMDVLHSAEAVYLGDRLTEHDIDQAALYLCEQKLIEGIMTGQTAGPVRVKLTSDGRDCVEQYEGDVVAGQQGQRRGHTVNNFESIVQNNGAMAIASPGATLNTTTTGIDPAGVANLVQTLLAALDRLPLADETRTGARTQLEAVHHEVQQAQPDTGRVTAGIGRAVDYLMAAGQPVVTALLLHIAAGYGLPPA